MSRVKVKIKCNNCREKFVVMGRRNGKIVETGFKACTCGNDTDLEFEVTDVKPRNNADMLFDHV